MKTIRSYDGLHLRIQSFSNAPNRPLHARRPAILLVHGYAEHSGRYDSLTQELASAGINVWRYDLRGHGRSEGQRGWIGRFEQHELDLHEVVRHVSNQQHGPLYLLGHSLGGTIVARYCIAHGFRPEGVILSSPAMMLPSERYPLMQQLAPLLDRLIPRARLVDIGIPYTSRDPEAVRQIHEDPLFIHQKMPVHYAVELLRMTDYLQRNATQFDLPVLFYHGTGDKITDHRGTVLFHNKCRSKDKTLHLYEDFYHETFRDIGREQVISDLLEWLEERIEN